jgi:hypothetical protein
MTDFSYNYRNPGCYYKSDYLPNKNTNSNVFNYNHEKPIYKNGLLILNPELIHNNLDKSFRKINENYTDNNCEGSYTSSDPRLYNAAAATWLQLDRPPLISTHKLDTLGTDNSLNFYGKGYTSYKDVNAGQIVYYKRKDSEKNLFNSYDRHTKVEESLYKDPMGSVKPEFNILPTKIYNPITDKLATEKSVYPAFLRDSQFHREDIFELKMRSINENRHSNLYSNSDKCA